MHTFNLTNCAKPVVWLNKDKNYGFKKY